MASRSKYLKRQAGQSVIIAIAVLFILAFLAAIFVALLARNLENTNRESEVLTADFYAQAGIQYANQMLTTSAQGADWRPPLQYKLSTANAGALTADEQAAYNTAVTAMALGVVPTDDPDSFWLNQGFTRYDTQGGRFLLRISYGSDSTTSIFDNQNAANSKYIRIEAIGRTGVVIANDPTTFTPQPIRLHAELVAYKPIGLVDYSRFITNKYDRADTANLGVPSTYDATVQNSIVTPGVYDFEGTATPFTVPQYPLVTTYGNPSTSSGGSLRCNTNLRLYGFNAAFLNGTAGDDWEIAGNLTFDGFNASTAGTTVQNTYNNQTIGPYTDNPSILTVTGTNTGGTTPGPAGYLATPSNITSFGPAATPGQYDSVGGLIRDGNTGNDLNGNPRAIQRLNPPSLDVLDPSSGLNRYQEITQSGQPTTATYPGPYNPESATTPATVYIDNISDAQPESSNVQSGGYTLRDDWLNRTSLNWEGPFYNPPGATIVFGPIYVNVGKANPQPCWGFTVTRTDAPVGLTAGSPVTWQWKDPVTGSNDQEATPTIEFAYGVAPAGFVFDANNPVYFLNADTTEGGAVAGYNNGGLNNNDVVIYAEGNVRVRGVVSPTSTTDPLIGQPYELSGNAPPPHHVTIVTGQIAYIEGSLLKGGVGYTTSSTGGSTSNSSIAVMAESYVCLNTTQFLAGASLRSDMAAEAADPASGTIDFDANTLTEAFDLPGTNANYSGQALYLSQEAPSTDGTTNGLSYGQITLNQTIFNDPAALPTTTVNDGYDLYMNGGETNAVAYLQGASGAYNRTVIPSDVLGIASPPTGFTHLSITFAKSPESPATYQLQRAAVLPSDVRIEAVLYAQDNSFFVIPGPWFNDDSTDTIDQYVAKDNVRPRPDENANPAQPGFTDERFPFFGQPIDMQITIDGSVIENMPADISDQSAWMAKWGWIPKYQGAPAVETPPQQSGHWPASTLYTLAPLSLPTTLIPTTVQQTMPAIGLNIAYDPTAGTAASTYYDRLDQYGRPLPYTPDLPVSPDLLYGGATPGNSLVQ